MANTINCPVCGKLTDSRLDSCPHCGGYLKSRRQQRQAPAAAKARKTCPRCGSGVQEGDIICVACGTNLLTGQKIVDEARLRQRQRSSLPMGWLLGGGIAAVLIVVIGFLWIYAVTRDPLSQARRMADDGRTMDAINLLQEYVDRVPNHGPATMELARLQWRIQQYDDAAVNFAKVSQLDPQNTEAALFAARAAARSGAASPRELAELLERAAALERNDAGLWYTLALARGASGDNTGAIEALKRVLEIRATDDSAHLAMAVTQGLNGDLEAAETEFLTVGGERKAEALAGLGFVALIKGNTAEAPKRLSEAVATGELPAAAQVNLALGRMQLEQGAFAEAQASLESAIATDPNNRQARFLRGLCLQARGRIQEALQDFESLLNTPGDFAGEAAIQAADAHVSLNVPDRARRALEAAIRNNAKTAAFFTAQGRLALITQDAEGALVNFETAIRTDPSYAGAYLERGLVYIQRDQIAQGLADLETYLKLVGDRGAGTRIEEVRALADQLRQAGQPESTQVAREGGE